MAIRVLCLGAFANGNLGDMYQADALARLLRGIDPAVEVTSVSPSKRRSDYPTRNHAAGPRGGAFDPAYINGFDLLLVGGGGLLSAPHPPLNDPAWVEAVRIPICTVSLGAVRGTVETSTDFVRKCALFSVRDDYSLRAVAAVRSDVPIIMDPILLDQVAQPRPPAQGGAGILWVPGKLMPETEATWRGAVERLFQPGRDRMMSFNPVTDQGSGFDTVFPDMTYLTDLDPFLRVAFTRRLVLSERYHACIYALASGLPAIGVCLRTKGVTSKIEELFHRLGHPDAIVRSPFAETRENLAARARTINLPQVRDYLMAERDTLNRYLTECLQLAR